MKLHKKHISLAVAAFVMLGLIAGSCFFVVPHTKAASPFTGHNIKVQPTYKSLGALSKFTTNGKVLFPCQSNSNPNPVLCYGPDQIRQAYGVQQLLNRHITGKGSSITIIDAYGSPTIEQDLKTFDATWGLPDPKFNVIAPFGINGSDFGWALESTLDVEWAHVMAPGATINLVVASTNNDIDILNATQYVVDNHIGDVISQSFGENESCVDPALLATEHGVFEAAAKKGISVLASSGDSGSAQLSCDGMTLVQAVSSPASDPFVTAVGGTELTADATTGQYIGETAWNESASFGAATGGGISVIYSRPTYQSGVAAHALGQSTLAASRSGRGVPDVALNASINGGVLVFITDPISGQAVVFIVGGTSVSSPEFAGIVADGVQQARHPLGFLNRGLYRLGRSGVFNDITSGNNVMLFTGVPGFTTARGWDAVTGWGTPKADRLLPALVQSLR